MNLFLPPYLSLISLRLAVPLLAVLLAGGPCAAQNQGKEEVVESKVYTYVEQMPELPGGGGNAAIVAAIQERLVYPADAAASQQTGRVFLNFVIGTTGRITEIKVVKGLGASLDEAAVDAVRQLPRFVPGKQNGRTVAVSLTVPITFSEVTPSAAALKGAPRVYTYVEQMPALPGGGGQPALLAALQKALVLPAEVREGRTEGLVQVSFVVSPDGVITDPKVLRGLAPAPDAAVLAALRKLPRLAPGKQNGRAVPVSMTLPVTLRSPSHVYNPTELPTRAAFPAPGLYEFIRANVRVPAIVMAEKLRGRIRVDFVVRETGRVEAAEVKKGLCTSCDAEALRLVRAFPAWMPARHAGGQPAATRQFVEIPMPLPDPAAPFPDTEKVFPYASQMPTLLDGTRDLGPAIGQALRYSEAVRRENISGTVQLEFVVDADGLVRRPRIVRPLCASCDQAVLDALTRVAPFIPGRQGEQAVPVQLQVQVPFLPQAAPTGK